MNKGFWIRIQFSRGSGPDPGQSQSEFIFLVKTLLAAGQPKALKLQEFTTIYPYNAIHGFIIRRLNVAKDQIIFSTSHVHIDI